ncbi:hypothetical protein COLO4_32361 [Corchorus olitorius]|uniref:Transmembrane protein n=1 Tax=Corchorus olitorius TaxID=93759 RepID=A0A1R3GZU1_9ROSI|nr:hypothetical protein COLO4_32361 [Corchorus olitorius]
MASSKSKFLIFAFFMALTFSSIEVSQAARLLQQSLPFTAPDPPSTRGFVGNVLDILLGTAPEVRQSAAGPVVASGLGAFNFYPPYPYPPYYPYPYPTIYY